MKKIDSYKLYIGSTTYLRFCWALMTTVSMVFMVFMVTVAGLDPLEMILVGTVLELSGFLFEISTGVVADVYSRRASIIIGYMMVGSGYALLGFFPRLDIILLSQFIWGIGFTFISGASQAWISDEIGEEGANRSFVTASQFGKVGFLVGIPVSISLAMIDLRLPIIAGSLGLVLLGVFCLLFMDEKSFQAETEDSRATWQQMASTFAQAVTLIKANPLLLFILLIAIFEGLYSEGYDRLNAFFLIESFTFPTFVVQDTIIWWGIMSAGSTIFAFASLDIVRRRVDTSNYRHLIISLTTCSVLLVAAMVFFALAGNFYMALAAYFGVSTFRAIKGPLSMAWRRLTRSGRLVEAPLSAQLESSFP